MRDGGAPGIVYLHGMTSSRGGTKGEALLELARAHDRAFARFDFRGHGESDGAMGAVTMSDLIADTAAVVRHVGRSVLVGSSMGALAAAWFAVREPEEVAALAMLAPAFGYLPEMARHTGTFSLRRADDSVIELQEAVLADARRYDETTLAGQLAMPLFVAHGGADTTVPARLSDAFCRAVPHVDKEYWSIDGGSHSLNEDIGMVVDRLAAFLDERGIL